MTKIDAVSPVPSVSPTSAAQGEGEPRTQLVDPALKQGDPRPPQADGTDAPAQPLFATMLADAAAPLENKTKAGLPLPLANTPAFTLGTQVHEKGAVAGDPRKKTAPKTLSDPKKKTDDAGRAPTATNVPIVPAERAFPAIPLTLPSFEEGAALTATTSEVGTAIENQLSGGAGTLDHVALSLQASAATDARNGLAAMSGVHRTAKAIAEDQSRIGVSTSESARTYAAIAKATPTPVTNMIHAAATSAEEPRARKVEGGATHAAEAEDAKTTTRTTVASADAARSGDRNERGSHDGTSSHAQARPHTESTDTNDTAAPSDGKSDAEGPTRSPGGAPAHVAFSIPVPTHAPFPSAAPVTKPEEVRAAFAEDTMSGVERAALSGHERTDFEVRAFDGTRVAINVQLRDDNKVHVGFAFDGKHTAAEATVRATLGSLETRLGERGLSTVVSFGTLQRSPQEVGVTAASNAGGAGGHATANGHGGNGKNGDPREQAPQLAEVTELPRQRQADARASKATVPTPNGRGGWVA